MSLPSLGIIIVAYGNESSFNELLAKLGSQKKETDQIVVIDNHIKHLCADIADKSIYVDNIIRSENIGFARGVNRAVAELRRDIDLVFLVNPDTLPHKYLLSEIRKGKKEWGAWMALLTLPNGRVNSAGNILHTSALSWCDRYDDEVSQIGSSASEVNLLSGACMVIRKEIWDKIGGFDQTYYMYYEDTDVSLAVRSLGYKLGLLPKAIVEHDYDYKKSTLKWFYIERNRYLLILQHWPVLLLVLYFPYFLIIELGLWAVSILQRRFVLKLKSTVSMLSTLPTAARMRHRAQKRRVISDYEFLSSLDPEITTPLLGYMASTSLVNAPSVVYFKIVKFIVGLYSEH